MGGSVKRLRAALAATVLAIGTLLIAGSCWNPLNNSLLAWMLLEDNMVAVPSGTLWLGSDDLNYPDENFTHQVAESSFEISRFEVDQGLYWYVTGQTPSSFSSRNGYPDDFSRPVESVTWLDAVKFCNQLSLMSNRTPCYTIDETAGEVFWDVSADGYRLPTEAEWEFAARGGTSNTGYYYYYAGSDVVGEVAWWSGNSSGITHPVGQKTPNELDLYDMSGNVWEFCWDTYDNSYYQWNSDWTDPLGPTAAYAYKELGPAILAYMVTHGGCYTNNTTVGGDLLRPSARLFISWNEAYDGVGFRVARSR